MRVAYLVETDIAFDIFGELECVTCRSDNGIQFCFKEIAYTAKSARKLTWFTRMRHEKMWAQSLYFVLVHLHFDD